MISHQQTGDFQISDCFFFRAIFFIISQETGQNIYGVWKVCQLMKQMNIFIPQTSGEVLRVGFLWPEATECHRVFGRVTGATSHVGIILVAIRLNCITLCPIWAKGKKTEGMTRGGGWEKKSDNYYGSQLSWDCGTYKNCMGLLYVSGMQLSNCKKRGKG